MVLGNENVEVRMASNLSGFSLYSPLDYSASNKESLFNLDDQFGCLLCCFVLPKSSFTSAFSSATEMSSVYLR